MNDQPPDSEQIVETQLRAYNDRNIDAFLATYAEDIEIYEFPARLMMQGHAQMGERYAKVFADELLHAVIAERIVMGNVVIDHERVRAYPGGRARGDRGSRHLRSAQWRDCPGDVHPGRKSGRRETIVGL